MTDVLFCVIRNPLAQLRPPHRVNHQSWVAWVVAWCNEHEKGLVWSLSILQSLWALLLKHCSPSSFFSLVLKVVKQLPVGERWRFIRIHNTFVSLKSWETIHSSLTSVQRHVMIEKLHKIGVYAFWRVPQETRPTNPSKTYFIPVIELQFYTQKLESLVYLSYLRGSRNYIVSYGVINYCVSLLIPM